MPPSTTRGLLRLTMCCTPSQASLAALVVTGIANRILYKMALVPLGNYVFFLAQFQTFGYVAVYFAVLALRRRCAVQSKSHLTIAFLPYARGRAHTANPRQSRQPRAPMAHTVVSQRHGEHAEAAQCPLTLVPVR